MGCNNGNCSGKICRPEIASPHIPPAKVGWRLVGWPDFVPDTFRKRYARNPSWEGNGPDAVIGGIMQVLKANRIAIDKEELCAWANGQWCAADPVRCRTAQSRDSRLASQRRVGLVAEPMLWATPFWRMWNLAVSGDGREDGPVVGETMDLFIEQARMLLMGEFGCEKCARHFEELLAAYPSGKVSTWRQARVWLWRVHNESRDSGRTVPYYDIAKIYGWEELPESEIVRIIEEELRA